MILVAAALLAIGVLAFTLAVRPQDLPAPEPVSPVKHLEERKATIYENLRDLQFEYRVGKLSERDYAQTKQDLQRELAAVLAEIDRVGGAGGSACRPAPPSRKRQEAAACPHCGARFPSPMKFCGECGKPIPAEAAK
jgi:hypothetical protein